MTLSFRAFLLEGETPIRLSQVKFNAFMLRDLPALPEYAGRSVVIVMVSCEMKHRTPLRIVRVDTMRVRVDATGAWDREDAWESIRLAMEARPLGGTFRRDGAVVDARALFEDLQRRQRRPELSGPALGEIHAALFGAGRA